MLIHFFYFFLAVLGLGFLIFIHELGHYFTARRLGMRIESFGIGFGKPIYTFVRNGVKWNICWLPFGGYVKIAGMEKEGKLEPHEIPDGFFGKSPWARIQVAIMGPVANILLSFVLFFILWFTGGREKSFSDVTKKIGWVDPNSELYKKGIRPGDEIIAYNSRLYQGAKDHIQAAMTAPEQLLIEGRHFDSQQSSYVPFSIPVKPYPHPLAFERGILTSGILAPASYLIYQPTQQELEMAEFPSSPMYGSGIHYGDRLVWANGERLYSLAQLSAIINDNQVLISVKRGDKVLLHRVPRVLVEELKLNADHREELIDWKWESDLKNTSLSKLFFIPYNVNADAVVESRLSFIDQEHGKKALTRPLYSDKERALEEADQIIAVDGTAVHSAAELLAILQTKKVLLIVERKDSAAKAKPISWKSADRIFDEEVPPKDLLAIEESIGTDSLISHKNQLYLLNPVTPTTRAALFQAQEKEKLFERELEEEKKHIQAIDDPEKRQQALAFLENRERQLLLGISGIQDTSVKYNPSPWVMCQDVANEVVNTLTALVGGYLNPKWISGPIGIVQVIQHQWMLGIKEVLFWLATISLNLGILNLLPLPVLDGGYIVLSLFELVTGRRLNSKTVEKIIIPFAILLIAFLIFLTYNDIMRLISGWLRG